MAPAVPPPGIYAPAITLFDPETDTLDLPSQTKYFRHLSHDTGLTGLVILGTNAETFLLTRRERAQLIATARAACPPAYPLVAGVSAHSTAQVLEHLADAAAAGADYALLLPCAYFPAATTPAVVRAFYLDVAARSPLPIVIYNFPGVTGGLDLDSGVIADLAEASASAAAAAAANGGGGGGGIVGVKLTCGSVAKINRLTARLGGPDRFAVFGGQSDFLIGALASGAAGCIAAFANVAPRTVVEVERLWREGKVEEARRLHGLAGLAEGFVKGGVASVKFGAGLGTMREAGVGAELEREEDRERFVLGRTRPRRPYVGVEGKMAEEIKDGLREVLEVERRLAGTRVSGET